MMKQKNTDRKSILDGCIILFLSVRVIHGSLILPQKDTSANPFRGQPMCFFT